jgi:Fe-Mn family superoxide dismutase
MKNLSLLFLSLSLLVQFNGFSQSHTLPELSYKYNALEPFIDSATMKIHHSLHHQAYVNNLNKALAGTASANTPLVDLLLNISTQSEVIRNNAGGHYNHSLFWEILSPKKETKASPDLLKAIENTFISIDSLKKSINKAAATRFGSGWAWLIVTPDMKLAITSSPNQDNPLMNDSKVKGIPIIAIDVWEHAYYLKYQNKRGDYLGAIWNVIDWEAVSKKYKEALADPILQKL